MSQQHLILQRKGGSAKKRRREDGNHKDWNSKKNKHCKKIVFGKLLN